MSSLGHIMIHISPCCHQSFLYNNILVCFYFFCPCIFTPMVFLCQDIIFLFRDRHGGVLQLNNYVYSYIPMCMILYTKIASYKSLQLFIELIRLKNGSCTVTRLLVCIQPPIKWDRSLHKRYKN